jgi:hypothetical protein
MKPILVLGPARDGASPRERRQVDMVHGAAAANDRASEPDYASVIVVNDGGADTVRRLRIALELRRRQKSSLSIGVLWYLDGSVEVAGALPGMPGQSPDLAPVLGELGMHLRIDLHQEALSVEYQAV